MLTPQIQAGDRNGRLLHCVTNSRQGEGGLRRRLLLLSAATPGAHGHPEAGKSGESE